MRQAEAERAIRRLCHEWAELQGIEVPPGSAPSFADFLGWVESHHAACLDFRPSVSVRFDVELWFDEEMGQLWRR